MTSRSDVAWWRIVPRGRNRVRDVYMRRFPSRQEAEDSRALLGNGARFEVVAYSSNGKRLR